jgi:hypothetical protein
VVSLGCPLTGDNRLPHSGPGRREADLVNPEAQVADRTNRAPVGDILRLSSA